MPENLKVIANSAPLWIIAFIIVSLVIMQALIFLRIASKAAPKADMTKDEVKTSIQTGLISAIGPSFAVAFVVISIISLIGSPLTLMRIGIIGSAATEAGAVQIGQEAFGSNMRDAGFTVEGFATIVWTMSVGGMGWLVFTLFFTKSLENIQNKIQNKIPKLMGIVSSAAMMGAFAFLASEQMIEGSNFAIAGIIALFTNLALVWGANKTSIVWLKQWSLGISMFIGMTGGYLTSLI